MSESNVGAAERAATPVAPFLARVPLFHRDPLLNSDDVRILLEVLSHDWASNDQGCTASQNTLAENCSVSETTVKRALKRLHHAGYILAPEPLYRGRERIGTRLRVSGKVREGRPMVSAIDGPGVRGTPPTPPVAAAEPRRRSFGERFRPGVERLPLVSDDAPRLRLLDEWGCKDSVDMLGVMLAVIAHREIQCGREASPARVRELFDSAARNRRFKRAGIANRVGLLLNGLDAGYLLGHGPKLRIQDLPPGARAHLEACIEAASHGGSLPPNLTDDLGVDPHAVTTAIRDMRTANEPRVRAEEAEEARRIREILHDALSAARYNMFVASAKIECADQHVDMLLSSSFACDLAKPIVEPVLNQHGYTVVMRVESTP